MAALCREEEPQLLASPIVANGHKGKSPHPFYMRATTSTTAIHIRKIILGTVTEPKSKRRPRTTLNRARSLCPNYDQN